MSLDLDPSLIIEKLNSWGNALLLQLPNLIAALLVLMAAVLVSNPIRRVIHSLLERISKHDALNDLGATFVRIVVIAIGCILALNILNLEKAVTTVLAGAGIIGLALGFAFQDLSANLISGIGIAAKRPFRKGNLVRTNDIFGIIERVELRTTVIRTLDGEYSRIPNRKLYENVLTNYTGTPRRRVVLSCGIAYGDALPHVREVTSRTIEAIDESRDVDFIWTGFGDSSINFDVRFWIEDPGQRAFLHARSKAIEELKAAFDAEGITIPFPIRTLDFGASAVGGENLGPELAALKGSAPAASGGHGQS